MEIEEKKRIRERGGWEKAENDGIGGLIEIEDKEKGKMREKERWRKWEGEGREW